MTRNNNEGGETGNILQFRRPVNVNIGVVICVIIFIYVLFQLFSYLTQKKVTIYEVKAGTIVSDHEYRAMAIRKEKVINCEDTGFLYYYVPNKSRVGVKTDIYSVDEKGDVIKVLTDEKSNVDKISADDLKETEGMLSSFVNDYNGNSFQKTYAFKDSLSETLSSLYIDAVMKAHSEEIEKSQSADTYHIYKPDEPGFVCYSVDGLEDTSIKSITPEMFDRANTDAVNLKSRESVEAGQPAYKLVTSDIWSLVIEADEDLIKAVKDMKTIPISFSQDNINTWASCTVKKKDNVRYLVLGLDDSMERYTDQRFIDVDLKLNEESGLKIPNSSIVEKSFYCIPKEYFDVDSQGDNGVSVRNFDDTTDFVSPNVFFEDKEFYYVDNTDLKKGDELVKKNSLETFTVGSKRKTLSGVYNVNKGYAIFKQIEPLFESDDYTIIRSGTRYGVSMFDHIVLQGALVKENDIIH